MPWCPKCKIEYREGMTECADCHSELVLELTPVLEEGVAFGEKEEMESLREFLGYNGITASEIRLDADENVYEIFVSKEDKKRAEAASVIFMQQEAVKKAKEPGTEQDAAIPSLTRPSAAPVYENSAQKAENFKSSAWTLLLVGSVGVTFLILSALRVLPFTFGTMTYVVMGFLFLLFLVMGISSMGSYKRVSEEAVSEESLSKDIKMWCREHVSAECVDAQFSAEGEDGQTVEVFTEEMKYFKRIEVIKRILLEEFKDLEDGFADALIEELYADLFEQEK